MPAKTSKPKDQRTRMARVEAHAVAARHPGEEAAIARFAQLDDVAAQIRLAREIVETRSAELTRAYSNVISVTVGFKSRQTGQGQAALHDEVCIVFVVKRKWSAGQSDAAQSLPRHLLAYGDVDGRRELLAVPTDVQPAKWFLGGVARGRTAVDVLNPHSSGVGTVTCGVTLVGAPGASSRLLLSALHVLSPVARINEVAPGAGLPFSEVGGGAVGASAPWGGRLSPAGLSFDAQLASATNDAWLGQAFVGISLSKTLPYAKTESQFNALVKTHRFQILAPANHPRHPVPRGSMLSQFDAFIGSELPLEYLVLMNGSVATLDIRHRDLVRLRVLADCPAPEAGDSGSAVVAWNPDGSATLVGMFIASPDDPAQARMAYVLPAWHLFNVLEWDRLPGGTTEMRPRLE
ncbi:hypothetical protein OOZ63_25810 [Paucibacter sp. PLA-PC-4]|uniref:hypothetical protein n=1 Tax=Paucibacter sp. PLA-PC-4 TaxID=2993655 RepID=UPI00224B1520|nr:hypothetical protein [Paucibacter sp. PLA-PC-4]MCX2865248.1 hypothetical protein [Paucibacter sp. PLA-PC-4]